MPWYLVGWVVTLAFLSFVGWLANQKWQAMQEGASAGKNPD
jgi:hypothetical protein